MTTPFFESLLSFINKQDPKMSEDERVTALMDEFVTDELIASLTFRTLSHGGGQEDYLIGDSQYNEAGYPVPLRSLKGIEKSLEGAFSGIISMNHHLSNQEPDPESGEVVIVPDDKKRRALEAVFHLRNGGSVDCCDCGMSVRYEIDIENKEIKPPEYWVEMTTDMGLPTLCTMEPPEPQTVTIPTPSKKIVIANDLRRLFNNGDDDDRSDDYIDKKSDGRSSGVNDRLGRELHSQFWEGQGLMYFQSGNTSPSIFVNDDGLLIARELDEDLDWYRENAEEDKIKIVEDLSSEQVDMSNIGYVCTDLWAITAMDYDLFIARSAELLGLDENEAKEKFDPTVVTVPDDSLSLTSFYELNGEDDIVFIRADLKPKKEISLEKKSTLPKP